MKQHHSLTIRMGAAHWDATINTGNGKPVVFNFRDMDTTARKKWYGAFMSSVRKMYRPARGGARS